MTSEPTRSRIPVGIYEGCDRDWTRIQRLDLLDWLGAWNTNIYIWCCLGWDAAYTPLPEAKSREVREAIAFAHASALEIWIALKPGDHRYCMHADARRRFIDNSLRFLDLGADGIAIFMDDTHPGGTIAVTDAPYQASLVAESAQVLGPRLRAICGEEYHGRSLSHEKYWAPIIPAIPMDTMIVWTGPRIWNKTLQGADLPDLPRSILLFDNYFAADSLDQLRVRDSVIRPYEGRDPSLFDRVGAIVLNPNHGHPWNFCSIKTAMSFFSDPVGYEPNASLRSAIMELGERYWKLRALTFDFGAMTVALPGRMTEPPSKPLQEPDVNNQRKAVLIPRPAQLEEGEGVFGLGRDLCLFADPADTETFREVESFAAWLSSHAGVEAHVITPETAALPGSLFRFERRAGLGLGKEGYELSIRPDEILFRAEDSTGLFYATRTLRLLLPPEIEGTPPGADSSWALPCLFIRDIPRFGWRGFMLDSARHFQSKELILRLLDLLALFKMNVFHWHLVDDQGWRLDIEREPQLTAPRADQRRPEFYSRTDVREIVERARALHITVVPEIEMPGHSWWAISTTPDVACLDSEGHPVQGVGEYCLASARTTELLENVLLEVMSLFPDSPWIHLGGDEASAERWVRCPRCCAKMRDLDTNDPIRLYKWFLERLSDFVRRHGRRSLAWADRLDLGVPTDQIVHGWHEGDAREAVSRGHQAIEGYEGFTYFDYPQCDEEPSRNWMPDLPLEKVYSFDPGASGRTDAERALILGSQAHLWTELVPEDRIFFKVFPRLLATAEILWTSFERQDYRDFLARLPYHLRRLDIMGIPYTLTEHHPTRTVGTWSSDLVSEAYAERDWVLTDLLDEPGLHIFRFSYKGGAHRLDIAYASILENGVEIARDEHAGTTGWQNNGNLYSLTIPEIRPGAVYRLRARIRSDGGTDSCGVIKCHRTQ